MFNPLPRKGTKKRRVVELRLRGLTNAQISERAGYPLSLIKCLYCQWKNADKYAKYQAKWYQLNKNKINEYNARWKMANPDKVKEYRYRIKCNQAGVEWRI